MYTIVAEDPKADIPSRGCTRSQHVKYAAEDLEYIDGLSKAGPTGAVQGQAFGRRDSAFGGNEPLPGASVDVSGEGRVYNTTTDADGRYSVRNLDPATYRVTASHPGYAPLDISGAERLRTSTIHAGGCADIKVVLIKQWRGSIQGRAQDQPPGRACPDRREVVASACVFSTAHRLFGLGNDRLFPRPERASVLDGSC
jgi:hypothetical protein